MKADDPRHGSTTGYRAACRCIACRRAMADSMARRRARQYLARSTSLAAPSLGTKRRLQALVALGWTLSTISSEMGYSRTHAAMILRRGDFVQRTTADKVSEVYERLSMRLPPEINKIERIDASRARNYARRNGWLPPLAWDDIDAELTPVDLPQSGLDQVVVERILSGDMSLARTATRDERVEVVRRWTRPLADLERLAGWKPERYAIREAS